jgi:hypothetical protein
MLSPDESYNSDQITDLCVALLRPRRRPDRVPVGKTTVNPLTLAPLGLNARHHDTRRCSCFPPRHRHLYPHARRLRLVPSTHEARHGADVTRHLQTVREEVRGRP